MTIVVTPMAALILAAAYFASLVFFWTRTLRALPHRRYIDEPSSDTTAQRDRTLDDTQPIPIQPRHVLPSPYLDSSDPDTVQIDLNAFPELTESSPPSGHS